MRGLQNGISYGLPVGHCRDMALQKMKNVEDL